MAKSKRVSLSPDEIIMILNGLRIAAEDGSLFSEDEADFAKEEASYQRLIRADRNATSEGGDA